MDEDLSILKDRRKDREVRNHTTVNPEWADGIVWHQRVEDRGGAVVWMGEKVDTLSQMVRWDAPGGQAQRETSWEADFVDIYAQEWAGIYPGPWREKLARRGGIAHGQKRQSGVHEPERQSVI